jgi:hypothetical protein
MMNLMDGMAPKSSSDDKAIMTSKEFLDKLVLDEYGPNILAELSFVVEAIFNEQNGGRSSLTTSLIKIEEGEEEPEIDSKLVDPRLHLLATTRATLEDFLTIVNLMLGDEQTHLDDYQVAVARSQKGNMNSQSSNRYFVIISSYSTQVFLTYSVVAHLGRPTS